VEIEAYAPWHLKAIALQPHQQHLGVALREHGWAEQVDQAGPCWTALVDQAPIACAGFQECWEGRAIAWAILGDAAGPHMLALTRAIRHGLARHPAARIEAQALVGFDPATRWARLLGFVPETVLRKYHQGRDYQAFVLIKDGARRPSIVHEPVDRQRRGIGDDQADQDAEQTDRVIENHGGADIDGDHGHRNQAHNHDAGRHEEAHHKAGGDRSEEDNAQHPFDPQIHSTPPCRPPSVALNAGTDKSAMRMLKDGDA
jgi:hypothetical protein